jgi:pantetheine-phosphate adenylyltransferase
MSIAVYPGTFDPVHYGHIDIATRAARVFDRLIVAVYDRPLKNLLFSPDERVAMMCEALKDLSNVKVVCYSGLTVSFVREHGAQVIVRGLRVTYDFELEYQMALTNKKLDQDIETVCLVTSLEYAFLSSSIVKDVALAGGCVRAMAPPHVISAIQEKLNSDVRGSNQMIAITPSHDWPT